MKAQIINHYDECYQYESGMGVFSEVVAEPIKDSDQQVRASLIVKVTLSTYCTVASMVTFRNKLHRQSESLFLLVSKS